MSRHGNLAKASGNIPIKADAKKVSRKPAVSKKGDDDDDVEDDEKVADSKGDSK
jgi:hypothetical protein